MSLALRITIVVLSLAFAIFVVRLVSKDRMQLKYSLLWFVLCAAVVIVAIWPHPIFVLSEILGFETPANFIFLVGILLVLTIVLSLSVAASWQARYIRSLVQELALLKKQLDEK